ncbi:MAG: matrixin family metalloprotease, partial [Deltaproteobacteria bacterium]|nr:matrixin family metalloprotease [Deltaproteobacteria bacterium]
LGQLYKTQIISNHFRVEIARCELTDESAMATLAQAAGRAAQALDLRTDFVLQLSAGPVWGTSESVLGATQLLGRIPFATLSARPPLKVDRMARVIAHEIGHLVGLPHVDGSDIMLPNYREHGDFNLTRALFAAGLHRWFRRPWMREQHYFDDPCRFIAAWEKLAEGGFVVASRMESHRLATRLLVAPDSASTPCCARMLSAACAQGVEVACHTHAQLRELGWIHATAAAGTTRGL